jgi:hypothetical protein
MKETIAIICLAVVFIHTCQSKARVAPSETQNLVIEAVVEKIGAAPGVGSGNRAVYQFAKYKVTQVCEGKYNQQDIVVDHLILYGDELDAFRHGDKVRLVIYKSNTIFTRNNEDGFRNAHDKVEVFYIGEKPKLLSSDCVPCEPCELK